MDRHTLLKSLTDQIGQLEKMIRFFSQADQIRQLDIDLFKDKLRNLYDQIDLLNQANPVASKPTPVATPAQAPIPTQPTPPPPTPAQAPPPPKPPPVPPVQPEPTKHEVSGQQTVEVTEPIYPQPSQPLGEKIKPQKEAVNEIYGKAKAMPKSTANLQPISDILIAIGLNDRFLLTRELFNNDSALFKSTLTKLNSMTGFDEAQDFLKKSFDWDWEDSHTEHFIQIVKRRFL